MSEPVRTLRVIGYTRVSTDEQRTRPADDRRRIEHQCAAWQGGDARYELVEFLADIDVSGRVPLAEREHGRVISELLDARQPRADVVMVTSLDRLSRSSSDGIALLDTFIARAKRANPVMLVTLDDHVDLTTPWGRWAAKQRVLFGELERELIGERTANALRHKRATRTAYGRPPFGWDVIDGALVPNEAEQAVLARVRAARQSGVPANRIATQLNAEGVPGKRGGRWQAATIERTLKVADAFGQ